MADRRQEFFRMDLDELLVALTDPQMPGTYDFNKDGWHCDHTSGNNEAAQGVCACARLDSNQ